VYVLAKPEGKTLAAAVFAIATSWPLWAGTPKGKQSRVQI